MKLPYPCPRCGNPIMNYGARCSACVYGFRVKAFDPRLFKNYQDTPLSITMQPGRVVDQRHDEFGRRLFDIEFDYRPKEISHGHFADRCWS